MNEYNESILINGSDKKYLNILRNTRPKNNG